VMFFGWILKFFSSGVVKDVAGWLTAKSNDQATMHGQDTTAATQIIVAQMQGELAMRTAQSALSSRHDKLVSWIGAIFAFHLMMIMLDSVFHLGWKVAELPGPMADWEGRIVLALCCATPAVNVANRLIEKVWK
jgi:hypothetical protein